MTLTPRLEKIVDYVATSDGGANTLVQKVNGLAGEKTCACLVRKDVPQSRPELWHFIQKIEFRICIYPNAHAYLCNNSRVPPVMHGIKGGFRLFTTATPFIGGPQNFINIACLVTQWETDAWRTENGVGTVKRLLNKLASAGKLLNTMTGMLRRWIYANKHLVVGMDNAYA